jgi:hypothetical protein
MTIIEGGRGEIKKRMAQIKKRTVRQPATKVSMMGVADNKAGRTEQQRMQQLTIDGSGKGEQWLATTRVRGQWLAMVTKGGGGWKRDCHGQRGVIVALEVAEAS